MADRWVPRAAEFRVIDHAPHLEIDARGKLLDTETRVEAMVDHCIEDGARCPPERAQRRRLRRLLSMRRSRNGNPTTPSS